MIIIEEEKIKDVPFIHVFKNGKQASQLPLIIFLHGFTSTKEMNLSYSYLLAKKGFRVALPEANFHGERSHKLQAKELDFKFWEIVIQTIHELPLIKTFFEERSLINNHKIGVAGTSMGGITTLGALTQYDWISAAVSLMGAPSYQQFALKQLADLKQNNDNFHIEKQQVDFLLKELSAYDLSLNKEKLAGRPLLLWHGKEDEVVPYNYALEFYEQANSAEIKFILDKQAEHKVSQTGIRQAVDWLEEKLIK